MRMVWLVVFLACAAVAWAVASGHLERAVLAVRILDELRRPGPESWLRRTTSAPSRATVRLQAFGSDGQPIVADVYRPAERSSRVPVLLVPGLVAEGKDEPRVAPFAELLARAGFAVVVADLPSFRSLGVHPDNLSDLAAAFDAVAADPALAPDGRAGMFGISYAGGLAVLAALEPARASRVSFVASAGGYADLDTCLRFLATGRLAFRGRERAVTPDPYGRMVFVETYREFIEDPSDREILEAMVARRYRDPRASLADLAASLGPQGRLIYDLFETAAREQVPELIARLPVELSRRMARLSPGRRGFQTLEAKLYLAHARDDGIFPVSETDRIAARARPHVPVRVVVLEALQHVDPQPWRSDLRGFLTRDLPEGLRLAAWWYEMLNERGGGTARSTRPSRS